MGTESDLFRTVHRAMWASVRRRRWSAAVLGIAMVAPLAWVLHGGGGVAYGSIVPSAPRAETIDRLIERAERIDRLWDGVESDYQRTVAPIERVLLTYRDDPALARRIALALVSEARRAGLEPRLLLAVLLVENPWLDPLARSPVGARGLMQVMPQHEGKWPPCEPVLEDVEANICHGARIFAHQLQLADGNVDRALLRYNGCVHGTNTPNCHAYPYHVYARAGRASILAWLRPPVADGVLE